MTLGFSKITDVDPYATASWQDSLFLTFDIEWACDEVLVDTIDMVEKADVAATWFVTHDTPLLQRLRDNPNFELGIHPNFNFLLSGDLRNGATVEEVIDRLLEIAPQATSARSHSMTQNAHILDMFAKKGLTHDSNDFIPEQNGIELKPWRLWNSLIKVPYFWEDDAACVYADNTPIKDLIKRAGAKVFDFHPIHVFLNTENLERYEHTRAIHRNPEALVKHRYAGEGTRTALETLLALR